MDGSRAIRVFLITAAFGLVPALIAVLTTGQLQLHERINSAHTAATDLLFRYGTHLGDGLVPTAVAIALLFLRDWRSFMMTGLSAAMSALLVQLSKHTIFFEMDRPSEFLAQMPGMRLVPGVEMLHYLSFPSGHATAAFSTALALAVIIGTSRAGFLLAALASMIAFSRVYLSQHFTEDVLAGAMLGSITALAVWWWLYRSAFRHRSWLTRRPFRRQNQ